MKLLFKMVKNTSLDLRKTNNVVSPNNDYIRLTSDINGDFYFVKADGTSKPLSSPWNLPVISYTVTDPSTLTPSEFDRYLVPSSAIGDWSGHDNEIAVYKNSQWIFEIPIEGESVFNKDDNSIYSFNNLVWVTNNDTSIYASDGTLSSNRVVDCNGNSTSFSDSSSFSFNHSDGNLSYNFYIDKNFIDYNINSAPDLRATKYYMDFENITLSFTDNDTNYITKLDINDNGIIITDENSNKGLSYSDDYSTNFTARSLVDKEYVDNTISTVSMSRIADSDDDTYIDVEAAPDEDMIHFFIKNLEVVKITQPHVGYNNVLIGDASFSSHMTYMHLDDYNRTIDFNGRIIRMGDVGGSYYNTYLEIDNLHNDYITIKNGGINVEGGLSMNISTVTGSNFYLTFNNYTILGAAGSNDINLVLPSASSSHGKIFVIKYIDNTHNLKITPASGDLIEGASDYTFTTLYEVVRIQSNGSMWFII